MALNFNKEKLVPILEAAGFRPTTFNTHVNFTGDKKYVVHFKDNAVFRMDDLERVYPEDDKDDSYLQQILKLCEDVTSPDSSGGQPSENAPESTDQSTKGEQEKEEKPTSEEKVPEDNESVASHVTRQPVTGIKGITPQLCECGKIKIGIKGAVKESGKGKAFRPPKKLDHFIVTTTKKTADDDFEIDQEIMDILGENCTEIPVILLYDKPELNFLTSYAHYDSAQCQCRGDGQIAVTAKGQTKLCNPETCPTATSGKCKPNGVLSVMLQDAPRVGGVWKFRTTGWNSIRNLMSSIEFIHDLTGGRLAGLNLVLTLHEKTTTIPGTKTPTKVHMVNLEYKGNLRQLLGEAQARYVTEEKMALMEARAAEKLALPESPEECKDVQEEFYPETVVAEEVNA